MKEMEWFWRCSEEEDLARRAIARVWRSIGVSCTDWEGGEKKGKVGEGQKQDIVNDAMDVLAICGPQYMHAYPSVEQLDVVARKLICERGVGRRIVKREDFKGLMRLLLSMRLYREKWGSFYHFGEFVDEKYGEKDHVEEMVDGMIGGGCDQWIKDEQLEEVVQMMVCLLISPK
jgi:hypothetical protein